MRKDQNILGAPTQERTAFTPPSATILHQPFSPPLGLKFAAAFKAVLPNITTFSTANLTQSQAPAMYSYRQRDNEQKIKPFFLPYIAFTILFPLLFAALVSELTNPKRLLPTNGNGKKRGELQSGTPDRRENWKLKAAASRSGPGNTLEVESRKTRVHTLHPQAARLAARECPSVCAISAGGGGGHLPGPPARPPGTRGRPASGAKSARGEARKASR